MKRYFSSYVLGGLTVLASMAVFASATEMEQAAKAFVHEKNYVPRPVDSLTADHYYSTRFFPNSNTQSISLPDADLDALTRAVLIVEANEIDLPHVRYHINYSIHSDPEAPELIQDYIEITRYNLGPARRLDVLSYIDAEYVASPEEFGVGPHVSWRFVMAPVMGLQADLHYAARLEVPETIAQKAMCFSQPCLSMTEAEIPAQYAKPMAVPLSSDLVVRPAQVAQELRAALITDDMDSLPYNQAKPQFVFVISKDVVGQENTDLGLAQQAVVLDDAIAKVWVQRHGIEGGAAEFNQAFIPRR